MFFWNFETMKSKFGDFWIQTGQNPSNFDEFRQNASNLLTLGTREGRKKENSGKTGEQREKLSRDQIKNKTWGFAAGNKTDWRRRFTPACTRPNLLAESPKQNTVTTKISGSKTQNTGTKNERWIRPQKEIEEKRSAHSRRERDRENQTWHDAQTGGREIHEADPQKWSTRVGDLCGKRKTKTKSWRALVKNLWAAPRELWLVGCGRHGQNKRTQIWPQNRTTKNTVRSTESTQCKNQFFTKIQQDHNWFT
jgi:hypothetical protein